MQTQDNTNFLSKPTAAPGVEVSYLPKETDYTGSTVLVFGRQRRSELINQLVSGQSVHQVDELVEALLKFITQPIVVMDNILTKHNMRRNGSTLMELVNTKTVFIGKSDATSFPDNVMAHVYYIFMDNSYNRDERKFIYEHYLKAKIPSLDQLNRSLNALEASEYLVVSVKSGEADSVYVYDIDCDVKIQQQTCVPSQPEQTQIPDTDKSQLLVHRASQARHVRNLDFRNGSGVPIYRTPHGITVTEDSEYIIPRNESIAQLDTPHVTTDKSQFIVHPGGVRNLDFRYGSGVPIYRTPHGTTEPVTNTQVVPEPQSWISYLTSFIW